MLPLPNLAPARREAEAIRREAEAIKKMHADAETEIARADAEAEITRAVAEEEIKQMHLAAEKKILQMRAATRKGFFQKMYAAVGKVFRQERAATEKEKFDLTQVYDEKDLRALKQKGADEAVLRQALHMIPANRKRKREGVAQEILKTDKDVKGQAVNHSLRRALYGMDQKRKNAPAKLPKTRLVKRSGSDRA